MPILTIAHLTLREAARRRLLLAVVVLTVVLVILTGWGFHKLVGIGCNGHPCGPGEVRSGVSAMLILLVFMFSFVLALGSAFLAAPVISGEVESGLVLSMLPRPIRRGDLVLGKWLGLAGLVVLYGGFACGLEFVIVRIATGYLPPHPVSAILFVAAEGTVILTLTLLGSTRLSAMTCGIIALVLFGMAWMSGIAGALGTAFGNRAIENFGTIANLIVPTDGLWRGAVYNLEPAVMVAAGSEAPSSNGDAFLALSPPTAATLIWTAVWVAGVLSLAVWSFSRREL